MRAIVLMIAAALLAIQARAADLPVQGKPAPSENISDNIHAYGDSNPSCQVWTDGCRRCSRTNGAPSCSNIGIACQPGAVTCVTPKSTQ